MWFLKERYDPCMLTETATFGAGCFWGVEETFRTIPGVTDTAVGYCGGTTENPRYEDVCTDGTGHAEVVQITFDPSRISYEKLLDIFWANHNPTTKNAQGPDTGSQYRSVIFYHSEDQRESAEASKAVQGKSGKWKNPIVTEIVGTKPFYRAEEYHQKYLMRAGRDSCS